MRVVEDVAPWIRPGADRRGARYRGIRPRGGVGGGPDVDEDALVGALKEALAERVENLTDQQEKQLRKELGPGGRRLLGRGHLMCALAAVIGEVCDQLGGVTGLVGEAVEDQILKNGGSKLLARTARKVTDAWLATLTAGTPLGQVKQVGLVADTMAVACCPTQQHGDVGTVHPEVQVSLGRLRRALTREGVQKLLGV